MPISVRPTEKPSRKKEGDERFFHCNRHKKLHIHAQTLAGVTIGKMVLSLSCSLCMYGCAVGCFGYKCDCAFPCETESNNTHTHTFHTMAR